MAAVTAGPITDKIHMRKLPVALASCLFTSLVLTVVAQLIMHQSSGYSAQAYMCIFIVSIVLVLIAAALIMKIKKVK